MQEQSQLIRGLIFSLYLLLSAGTLLVFLSMALQTLFHRPFSTEWLRITPELRRHAEDPACREAVYHANGSTYRRTIRCAESDGKVIFYIHRRHPEQVWSPPFGGSKAAAIAALLTVILVITAAFLFLRPVLIPVQVILPD